MRDKRHYTKMKGGGEEKGAIVRKGRSELKAGRPFWVERSRNVGGRKTKV